MILCIVGWRWCPSGWGPWMRWRRRARMAVSAWLVPQALPEAMAMCPAAWATARGQRGAPRWPKAGPRL
eukprot:1385939-Prorocentrum_lima.AAC.1